MTVKEGLKEQIDELRNKNSELEKKLDNFIGVRCTRSSDNFHINNHNERLNKHHTEIASLREKQREAIGNQLKFNQWCQEKLLAKLDVGSARQTECIDFDTELANKNIKETFGNKTEKKASGGEKESLNEREGIVSDSKYPSHEDDSKLSDIPLEPELEFGGKDVIKMPTDFDSKLPEPNVCIHGNYLSDHCFLCGRPREDELWTKDESKPKPLKIDINGIRLGKLIVVTREDLMKMLIELRLKLYGYDKEEWFTPIEKQLGYDYKEDLRKIKEERRRGGIE